MLRRFSVVSRSNATTTVVFLRHGQSVWNAENRFTGWVDVPLSSRGLSEAEAAVKLLKESGLAFDRCHTSYLRRAIKTGWVALEAMGLEWIPVVRDWRLNERHYGALTGLDKAETAAKYGPDQVFQWRRSYGTRPPPADKSSEWWPGNDKVRLLDCWYGDAYGICVTNACPVLGFVEIWAHPRSATASKRVTSLYRQTHIGMVGEGGASISGWWRSIAYRSSRQQH